MSKAFDELVEEYGREELGEILLEYIKQQDIKINFWDK